MTPRVPHLEHRNSLIAADFFERRFIRRKDVRTQIYSGGNRHFPRLWFIKQPICENQPPLFLVSPIFPFYKCRTIQMNVIEFRCIN